MVKAILCLFFISTLLGCSTPKSNEPLTPAEYRQQYEESRRDSWLLTIISSVPAILLAID